METKEIGEKTASELNSEILDLDVKCIDVKTVISNTIEDKNAIENNVTVNVRAAKELFKNETDRKIEIEKQLANNPSYKALKEQIDILNIQKQSQEARKSYLEREVRIIINENPETLRRLTEVSVKIRELEMDEVTTIKQVNEISEKQNKRTEEINKVINNKVFKNDEEKGKASIERILKDETIRNCVKDLKPLRDKLTQLKIDIEFFQRAIIIMGVVRGVKL